MAQEEKRGCGYRKVGGLYLVSGPVTMIPCHRLPYELFVCPTCGNGIKHSRGWTWINPLRLLGVCTSKEEYLCHTRQCPVCFPKNEDAGLLWVGEKFYTPDEFTKEAEVMGVSKRIHAVPRNFKPGETIVYLAHIKGAIKTNEESIYEPVPGIFHAFKPDRVEKILTESQATEEELKKLEKRGITPVVFPDDDKDHQ